MAEARIGRLLTAALHQAIVDEIPERLDFYEVWLGADALRDRGMGMAPMSAVLGFLRTERAYSRIAARAGRLAAEWTASSMSPLQRKLIGLLPRGWRARAALRVVARLVHDVCSLSRASSRVRGTSARLSVATSLFCTVREQQRVPLCDFYVAAATEMLTGFGLPARAQVEHCLAVDGSTCVIAFDLSGADASADGAMAA
jgi:hypothetical protein